MKPTQTATSARAFLGILLLVLLWARLGLAIYHPDATRPPKVKERVDLKPLPGTAEDADSRPPVRVFRGRHRGPSGEAPDPPRRARPPPPPPPRARPPPGPPSCPPLMASSLIRRTVQNTSTALGDESSSRRAVRARCSTRPSAPVTGLLQ
ncbi:hypothetical protein C7M84_009751 [Penaeus vannamei]|uniref:Uncharacterized protein n=1 Tax=Penaeus vannamei TaxID=6689 RepID=A0A3R7MB49_PENVA|nr:hypothetical protein C7M84_009751 [Penaeus vannamei]